MLQGQSDAPTADIIKDQIADEISNALKGFDPEDNKRLHAAAHNTIEQLSGNTSSGHVVYRCAQHPSVALLTLDPLSLLLLIAGAAARIRALACPCLCLPLLGSGCLNLCAVQDY